MTLRLLKCDGCGEYKRLLYSYNEQGYKKLLCKKCYNEKFAENVCSNCKEKQKFYGFGG